jgi:hypothetical protein
MDNLINKSPRKPRTTKPKLSEPTTPAKTKAKATPK